MKAQWGLMIVMAASTMALAQLQGMEMGATGDHAPHHGGMPMAMHEHASGAPVSYAELKDTVAELETAQRATDKYHDVRVAEADGYRAIGPDVPGMGIHYVLQRAQRGFAVDQPPILLYESDAKVPGGMALVGVSYLLVAPEGEDGQPLNAPFPKALAKWHRHENICVLPDRSTPKDVTEAQCTARGGHFTAETQWMVHAWIWKDSPLGVFSPMNPNVR
jgi:hypothetical protein